MVTEVQESCPKKTTGVNIGVIHPTCPQLRAAVLSQDLDQKHLRCTIVGPDSSYSPFEIHICWKVDKEDKMDPPIQTEYLRSGGVTTLIFTVEGAKAVNSLVMRSPMPANMLCPPERTTFA